MSKPKTQEQQTLESILELVTVRKQADDMVKAADLLFEHVKDIKKQNDAEFEAIHSFLKDFKTKLETDTETSKKELSYSAALAVEKLIADVDKALKTVTSKAATLKPGVDGKTPVKGVDYFDGLPGADGSPDTPIEVRDKLESLTDDDRLDISAIKGSEKLIADLKGTKKNVSIPGWGAHPLQIQNSSGTVIDKVARVIKFANGTVTRTAQGIVVVTPAGSGAFAGTQEKSTTTPDNSTQTFAFAHTPTLIFWNGQLQTLTDDYTVSSLSITFTGTSTPQTGDKITNIYA